ncbi:unnamed protein product [Lathyrus oleraceus]
MEKTIKNTNAYVKLKIYSRN